MAGMPLLERYTEQTNGRAARSYVLLVGLLTAVVAMAALIVAAQLRSL